MLLQIKRIKTGFFCKGNLQHITNITFQSPIPKTDKHMRVPFLLYIYMSKYNTNTNTIYKSTKIMYIKVLVVSMMQ